MYPARTKYRSKATQTAASHHDQPANQPAAKHLEGCLNLPDASMAAMDRSASSTFGECDSSGAGRPSHVECMGAEDEHGAETESINGSETDCVPCADTSPDYVPCQESDDDADALDDIDWKKKSRERIRHYIISNPMRYIGVGEHNMFVVRKIAQKLQFKERWCHKNGRSVHDFDAS